MKHFFEGWYFKHQCDAGTLALIPGFADGAAFIQLITDETSLFFPYELPQCSRGQTVKIGNSAFSRNGMLLDIQQNGCSVTGAVAYTAQTPPSSDIMGIFRFFPMQCRHGVISLHHSLHGRITLNGKDLCLDGGTGYIEKDSGTSFPKSYAWIQSNDFPEKCCVMAAVADIPFLGFHFGGIICAIWYRGREYRLATYAGARVLACTRSEIILEQGNYRLEARVQNAIGHALSAPRMGKMSRIIKESPSCEARFTFRIGDDILFDLPSGRTSFEFCE